eukprot:NODE_14888_length_229_cov_9.694444_g13975_i0.p3 GENE.NODE_14888_length_229_cov_9.694444_g13975_i0~~NODE_14888_length_229_cov_9.694444_g13975_i0.p3  ORF type:complete len:50 (+),score=19.06 NODE_14888_length_229_cov_9.694444_g13975_i0:26-151(+)
MGVTPVLPVSLPNKRPFTKQELQCPRSTYWEKISVCEMEFK